MEVTGWNNGAKKISGSGYGFRVSIKDRDAYFKKDWNSVLLVLAKENEVEVKITPSFWNRCFELRSKEIGKWLIRNGFGSWSKGNPPKFAIVQIKNNRFKVL